MKPEQTPADAGELDQASMAAIRDLMATEAAPVAPKTPRAARRQAAPELAGQPARPQTAPRPEPQERLAETQAAPPRAAKPRKGRRLADKIRGYRPKPKHVLLAAAVLLVLFRPWLVVGILFILAVLLTGIFLILGYDGFWHRVMGIARWYARRRPSRSEAIHRKLDGFAMRFDAFLDRFPEGSVDGLYLPDFGDLAAAEARHDAALDARFSKLRES